MFAPMNAAGAEGGHVLPSPFLSTTGGGASAGQALRAPVTVRDTARDDPFNENAPHPSQRVAMEEVVYSNHHNAVGGGYAVDGMRAVARDRAVDGGLAVRPRPPPKPSPQSAQANLRRVLHPSDGAYGYGQGRERPPPTPDPGQKRSVGGRSVGAVRRSAK